MEKDNLQTAKALRKAKKKAIQAWITAFEEREGRSPGSRDKEVVRPMYREFKELETRVASLELAEQDSRNDVGAASSVDAGVPTSPSGAPIVGQLADGDAKVGNERGLVAIKQERDDKKRQIKLWIKEFEEREGRPPTTEEKAPIKDLYREFKSLERQLANPGVEESVGSSSAVETTASTFVGGLEGVKAEKKQVKREIQAWLDSFEAREGRAALQTDKSEIRPLYKRHKDLERELERLNNQIELEPTETTMGEVSASSGPLRDTKDKLDAGVPIDIPTTDNLAPAQGGNTEFSAVSESGNDSQGQLDKQDSSILEQEQKVGGHETAAATTTAGDHEGESSATVPSLTGRDTDTESKLDQEGDQEQTDEGVSIESKGRRGSAGRSTDGGEVEPLGKEIAPEEREEERGSVRGRHDTRTDDDSTVLSPLPSLSPERSVVRDGAAAVPSVLVDSTEVEPLADGALDNPEPSLGGHREGEEGQEEQNEEGSQTAAGGTIVDQPSEAVIQYDGGDENEAGGGLGEGIGQSLPDHALEKDPEPQEEEYSGLRNSSPGETPVHCAEGSTLSQSVVLPDHPTTGRSSSDDDSSVFGGVKQDRVKTAQETRVGTMRSRFLMMKNLIDSEEISFPPLEAEEGDKHSAFAGVVRVALVLDESQSSCRLASVEILAGSPRARWTVLGDVVAPKRLIASPRSRQQEESKHRAAGARGARRGQSDGGNDNDQTKETTHRITDPLAPPTDDSALRAWAAIQTCNLVLSDAPPPRPPPPSGLENLEAEALRLRDAVDPAPPEYAKKYQEGVRGAELVVASVGVEEVKARERMLELERLADAREETNVYRAREANLLHREDQARRRVLAFKRRIERKIRDEKNNTIAIAIAREQALVPAFARARRGLESAIRAKAGRVREVFGELRPGETVAGRRFRVDWPGVPQPVEIRLHCIRAVRDRLPRGSYVMLSSMAERLGGRVMRWSKRHDFDVSDDEDGAEADGGDTRPAATLPVQHGGRYFDRELRLDQSVYQLCPSKSNLRPGNVLVFELFRLAGSRGGENGGGDARSGSSRHMGGELDEDTAVGWCVLPIADSRLRVTRGSFRIPLLRGEPNPNIDLHEGLEKLLAADLEAWLGNLYLDIRHLTREARLEGPGVEGGSAIGGEGFDIEYDHVRKEVRLGKGLSGTQAKPEGRWWRWRGKEGSTGDGVHVNDATATSSNDPDAVDSPQGVADIETGGGGGGGLIEHSDSIQDQDKTPPNRSGRGNVPTATVEKQEEGASAEAGVGVAGGEGRPTGDSRTEKPQPVAGPGRGGTDFSGRLKKAGAAARSRVQKRSENEPPPSNAPVEPTHSSATVEKQEEGASAEAGVGVAGSERRLTGDSRTEKPQQVAGPGRGGTDFSGRLKKAGFAARSRVQNRSENKPPPSTEAPPPQGGWMNATLLAEGDADGDGVDADKTLDEECLSDDDLARGSTFHFTPAGEASLAVDSASGDVVNKERYARGVGLRRRGEGARWDSAALGMGRRRGMPRRYGGASTGARDAHVWTPLKNPAEMEYYRFSVASDPGTEAPPTPAHVIRHKLRYIQQEMLLDLHPGGWRAVDYWLAVMVFLGALWIRVYLHTLGQWFLLHALGVPVFSFSPRLWEFAIKYIDNSSTLGLDIAFVSWGPTFVLLCFSAVALLARVWGMAACGGKGGGGGGGLPQSFSRFVAAFGVGALLDPYLLFVVDFMAGNHHCSEQCSDYTSPSCRCHQGDAWKLYMRLEADEGAGVSGVLLTAMIYAVISMATGLVLHQYLLYAHMNGRLLDVWRRLNAGEDDFFVPHDFEVSSAELQHACLRASKWRGAGGAHREVVIHDFHVNQEVPDKVESVATESGGDGGDGTIAPTGQGSATEKRGKTSSAGERGKAAGKNRIDTTHVAIYDVAVDGQTSLHRQFIRTSDGTILEIFGDAGREVGWKLASSLKALVQEKTGGGDGPEQGSQDKGIFAGLLPAATLAAAAAFANNIAVKTGGSVSFAPAGEQSEAT